MKTAHITRHCPDREPTLREMDYGNYVGVGCSCGLLGREFRIRFDGDVRERKAQRERAYELAVSAWNDGMRELLASTAGNPPTT